MRIIYHIGVGVVGGAETQVEYLINNLPKDVRVLITYDRPEIERFLLKNVKCKNLFRAFSPGNLARKISDFKPDIIQFYHCSSFYNALTRSHYHAKVIEVAHNSISFPGDCSTYHKDRTDMLVCVSQDTRDHYITKRGRDVNMTIIPNGIDSAKFYPPESRTPRKRLLGGYCGRLECGDGKGVTSLIKIISKLPVDFELVGYDFGNYRQQLEGNKQITYLPYTADIGEFYRKWDFFVSCSPKEGFGLAIAEALACGLPSVILDCGGVCRYLVHKKHAYIASSMEDVEAGIRTIIDGEKYRPLEVDFGAARMAREYMDLYEKMLSNRAPIEVGEPVGVKEPAKVVLGVVPDDRQGIMHALEKRVTHFCDPAEAVAMVLKTNPSEIIFGGFLGSWYPILKKIKEVTKAPVTITYHATAVLNEFEDLNREAMLYAMEAVRRGLAEAISVPHEGMAKALNKLYKVKAIYEPNVLSHIEKPNVEKLPGINLGLFGTGMPWKNTDTQILAAAITPGLNMLHVQNVAHQSFMTHLGVKYKVHPYYRNRTEFYRLAAQMRINLAVSLTETFGYFALESLLLGVPPIVSITTPSFRTAEGPLKKCIVSYIDDPSAISDAIQDVLENYDSVLEAGISMIKGMS